LALALMGKDGEDRFKREGKILALLIHRHIAVLVDAGVTEASQPYLILERAEGGPSTATAMNANSTSNSRLRLFLDVLEAVAKVYATPQLCMLSIADHPEQSGSR
jgi:eukaryotic-like serine/threonine-protein kinase